MAIDSVGSADAVLARITGLVAAMTPEGLNVGPGCPWPCSSQRRHHAPGELDFGNGRSVRDFDCFTHGTGIGGGISLDGRLRMGAVVAAVRECFGAANVDSMLHPEMVENGGGMAKMGERLLAPLRGEVARRVKMCPLGNLQIEASLSSPRAGNLGGLGLARRRGVI